jgi:hypothetical protein
VEHCEATAARIKELAGAAVVATTTGHSQRYSLLPNATGDVFVVRISGEVNGKPFDVTRGFDYGKIAFGEFPSESPVYREHVSGSLREAVDAILAIAGK